MAEIITMPRLSDTMEEGTVAKWHKNIGDKVEEGDLLAEIETDKATMDFESFQEGTLLYIGIEEGNTAPVDSILAIVGNEGEDFQNLLNGNAAAPTTTSTPEEVAAPAESEVEMETAVSVTSNSDARIKASPLAKKLASEKGIDISQVNGTGEGGRIVKKDVDQFQPNQFAQPVEETVARPTETPSPVIAPSTGDFEEVNVSQMRKTIARRLSDSKFTAPHFYLTVEIDMGEAMAARKQINEVAETKISFNDFVVKAAAVALQSHPQVNSAWLGDKIRINKDINIGVAVAVEEGLLVPVVRNANFKGLATINNEVKAAAQKARDKKLQPQDWEGNTFTISNLGMFDIDEFTAIINSPDSCIMAVGSIKQKPIVKNGEIAVGNMMKVTLSCDHRVVDGAIGAAFLKTFKNILERPLNMLI